MEYLKNKYSEVEIIRKTNWADIYAAINNETHEKVQLKVLKSQSSNMKYINEIKYAVNELQDLKHENLIGINDMSSFIENNTSYYYIETEYFKGKTLGEKMILGSHTCRESLEIIKQVAQGLIEFHYRGLNYETLSAENIVINSQGVVKIDVLSYIQQKYDEDEEYDNYDEFDDGRDKDIYAIGIILYQLITRDNDFKLRKLKKNIEDEEVYSILYSLTSKKIKYRYENLNEFLLDVNEHLQNLSYNINQDLEYINENRREFEQYDDESDKSVLIKRLCACLAVVLVVVGGIKVAGLVKKDNNKTETQTEMIAEEESTDEEVLEEEPKEEQTENLQVEPTDTFTNDGNLDSDTEDDSDNSTTQTPNYGNNSGNAGSGSNGSTSGGNHNGSGNNGSTSGGSNGGSGNNGSTSGESNSGSGNNGSTSGESNGGSGNNGSTSGESNSGSGDNGSTNGGSDNGTGTGGSSNDTSDEGTSDDDTSNGDDTNTDSDDEGEISEQSQSME